MLNCTNVLIRLQEEEIRLCHIIPFGYSRFQCDGYDQKLCCFCILLMPAATLSSFQCCQGTLLVLRTEPIARFFIEGFAAVFVCLMTTQHQRKDNE